MSKIYQAHCVCHPSYISLMEDVVGLLIFAQRHFPEKTENERKQYALGTVVRTAKLHHVEIHLIADAIDLFLCLDQNKIQIEPKGRWYYFKKFIYGS